VILPLLIPNSAQNVLPILAGEVLRQRIKGSWTDAPVLGRRHGSTQKVIAQNFMVSKLFLLAIWWHKESLLHAPVNAASGFPACAFGSVGVPGCKI
jgi:hypothetical protein